MERNTQTVRKSHSRRKEGEGISIGGVALRAFIGVGVALAAMLVLSAVSSGLCMLSPDPAALTLPIGIIIFLLSSAAGGAVSAKGLARDKTAAVFSGILCGFSIMLFLGVGAIVQNALAPDYTHEMGIVKSVLIRAAAIPISGIVAFLTVNRRKNKRHRRK